jgi:2-methylcitrate dehydratase PrpD
MNRNEIVSDFIAHTAWEKLPPAVQRKARMALLDILGATLAGTLTPASRIAAGYAVETWPGDEATILQHGYRASAIGAAFANGYAANGMDIDDCALHTRDHPGAQIFPTALALTESLGLGGAEMLTAMVVGYEVAHRIAVDGLAWKKYACCAWVHAALKGVEELVKAHHIRAEVVAHVRVEAPHDAVRLGTELPTTTEEAQFSVAWPLAALLVDGEVGPDQMLEHRFGEQRIRDLAGKIELVETEEMNELYRLAVGGDPRGKYASKVTITLKEGRTFNSGTVEGDINFPQQGWDEARVEAKFRWLTSHVLEQACINELVEMAWHFEQVSNVRELTQRLA